MFSSIFKYVAIGGKIILWFININKRDVLIWLGSILYFQDFNFSISTLRCESMLNTSVSESKDIAQRSKISLIFLGSGNSSGTPVPFCLLNPEICSDEINEITKLSLATPPQINPYYRNNPSLLIQHTTSIDRDDDETEKGRTETKNILIDCGKTFRQSVLTWFDFDFEIYLMRDCCILSIKDHFWRFVTIMNDFPYSDFFWKKRFPVHKIKWVDGIILTHFHLDAIAGFYSFDRFWERMRERRLDGQIYVLFQKNNKKDLYQKCFVWFFLDWMIWEEYNTSFYQN